MSGEKEEFYAASVQEAIDKAAKNLGIATDQVEYSILDEGSSGFLGIGTRDARISVTVPTVSPEPNLPPQPLHEPANEQSSPFDDNVDPSETSKPEEQESSLIGSEVREDAAADPVEEAPEDLVLAVDGFTTEILEKMGFDAIVDAYDAGEVIRVDVATKETGLLIGQKGETIDAVQYLLNVVVYKSRPFIKRITVDTEGYRQRRVEALQGMAHRAARRVQRERRSVDLPPMAAAERRVVHVYLKDNANVSTSSEGQDNDRRVVISPSN